MNVIEKPNLLEMKSFLSTLWIFVLLNILFKDIHELFRVGFLEQMISGTVNGVQVTASTMLLGGIVLEIPILMVVLSRVLAYPINRWLNMILPMITAVIIITSDPVPDADNIFFAIVEIITLATIAWLAWRWPK